MVIDEIKPNKDTGRVLQAIPSNELTFQYQTPSFDIVQIERVYLRQIILRFLLQSRQLKASPPTYRRRPLDMSSPKWNISFGVALASEMD